MITIHEQTATAFLPWQPSPPNLVHEQKLYFNSSQIVNKFQIIFWNQTTHMLGPEISGSENASLEIWRTLF